MTDFIVPFREQKVTIIYADEDILVVDKPSGLLSVPGKHPLNKDCLITRVQQQYSDAFIVHRLDMDTSGIMILARGTHSNPQGRCPPSVSRTRNA